ncbi:MAG: DUF692 domain-containing protein [Bacteriovoracaceae bacterium]|nr:DUF692 domain-containing protein [Bacteriovoracaceae bacterium]
MNKNCHIGVGLRSCHYPYLEQKPATQVKWFEAISENYMDSFGRPRKILELIRADYPISLHGVSLSIGRLGEDLNFSYLEKLKNLIEIIDPFLISDHLCWTGASKANLHNLLPLSYDKETLNYVCERIQRVQDFLQRSILIENLSAYFDFKTSTYTEWDFLRKVAERSGCKLLLDINNIYVNAQNHKFDANIYLGAIPSSLVGEIHLAGFSDMGDYLFDTHSKPVYPEVWNLFSSYIQKSADIPILIEWDEDIPAFEILEAEGMKAKEIWEKYHA